MKAGREANGPRPPTSTAPTHVPCTQKPWRSVCANCAKRFSNLHIFYNPWAGSCTISAAGENGRIKGSHLPLCLLDDLQLEGRHVGTARRPDVGCRRCRRRGQQAAAPDKARHTEENGAGQGYSRELVAKPRNAASPPELSLPLPSPPGQAFP